MVRSALHMHPVLSLDRSACSVVEVEARVCRTCGAAVYCTVELRYSKLQQLDHHPLAPAPDYRYHTVTDLAPNGVLNQHVYNQCCNTQTLQHSICSEKFFSGEGVHVCNDLSSLIDKCMSPLSPLLRIATKDRYCVYNATKNKKSSS